MTDINHQPTVPFPLAHPSTATVIAAMVGSRPGVDLILLGQSGVPFHDRRIKLSYRIVKKILIIGSN